MKSTILFIIGMLFCLPTFSQNSPSVFDESTLELKVKQIDEFMHRLNFDTLPNGKAPADSMTVKDRLNNMYTVFRYENFVSDSDAPDSLITNFCNYVINNNLRLNYEDNNWTAEVICDARMDKKPVKISLLLQTENIRDVLYKWVLVNVSADFLKPLTSEPKDSLFISPAEHGISFITLPRIINLSVADVNTVFKKGWSPDPLSVFNYLISTKKLVLNSVDKVIYHWTLGEYSFDVERFEGEDSSNQGWLVSRIIHLSDK